MNIILSLPAYLIVFALGASIGSFLNVVIYRIPAGLSILHPPSRCPHCLTRLSPSENIPVFGWLWLRGRCKHCHAPISSRYPIVEATTGLLFLVIFLSFSTLPQIFGYWVLFSWLIALSLIDLDTYTLPNVLTQSGLVLGLGFQLSQSPSPSYGLITGIIGAVLGLWLFDIISFVATLVIGQTAMGAGDSKLAAMMGAWLGWKYLLVAGFIACLFGAVVGGGAIAFGLISRRQPIPFGPFLALGATITALWGPQILSTYLGLFFPLVN
ncbi:Type 4 prepilin-like proteins leader peptide-processing enzyme (Includes: Leader peptidase; N-methyltransferase) [Planktothrix sp. PCC 11201]|uniref:prepilin peptidase n=1 Tax=Planktothrix sp. PCC 11201 TaxID=1729650 RepID=UPI0009188EC8|nr:A24 family peptidase [Planktothrix sp. PCC 11201]SKB12620.1 Type 4 prepilin-like proteins leader peptide-processing enzyme (Includes: Leader peptidase; N-methyltransferase) [Planktothrix sp. PCC 11201]